MSWLVFVMFTIFLVCFVGSLLYHLTYNNKAVLLGIIYALFIDILLFVAANNIYGWIEW